MNENHTHAIHGPVQQMQGQIPALTNWEHTLTLPITTLPGNVMIAQLDAIQGTDATYTTTETDRHSHRLQLTAADFAALRAGQTVRKQTSIDARQGGRRHSHEVVLSCAQQGQFTAQFVSGPGQLGQVVPQEIILSVQAALNRESDLRNSQRVFINSGVLNADMCQSLREWGGNAFDLELRTLVNSWGSQLQAACIEAGFGPPGSTEVVAVQRAIQNELRNRGNCLMAEKHDDGILGPQTCEAGRYLQQQGSAIPGLSQVLARCTNFNSNWVPTRPCPTGVQPPVVPPPVTPPPVISPPAVATGGGGSSAALAAFIAAVLIGGYLVTQS